MLFSTFAVALSLATAVSAHFQLQFPTPRGVFVEDDEPTFCDGYTQAVSNRSVFPLDNGFISLNSEHPQWSAAVLISIEQDPTTFAVFNTSSSGVQLPFAKPFFSATGEGLFCIPFDIGALKIPGVQSGSNVTIQVQFDGGDGNLFQCADLTLSSNFTIPSSTACTNATAQSSASSPSQPSTTSSRAMSMEVAGATGLLGVLGALVLHAL